ncbi:3-isopropylmalate dehydratase large subunit (plasmid) [Azospirillum sp. TSH58]|uniref:3-isopropylmalate dehydratase large subunit n=1 Tax=Azospirillum sp. TSH58 TaxID=664962 RepID=UPI000D602989|nr:3-isopropylmalate dehydratase large subunit [Azospirillum sp. TSH58]AWJ88069.1 3-isopropylmalate dehydratase large subunit [Azospirillum sp. TSH58]PWC72557.1 3-isopropylmalate dehydratase [Azospirillum sp. TSH58]
MTTPRSIIDKIWDQHVVADLGDGRVLLHIDRHMLHEVTSPQAYAGLAAAGRRLRRPDLTFATADHIVSTENGRTDDTVPGGPEMIRALRANAEATGVALFDLGDVRQGIVHVIAPELGIALPGATLVCGDSHTSTVGALGAMAWGIGTSEVEHVMATQTAILRRPPTMRITVGGTRPAGVSAKDMVLKLIATIGTAGATSYGVEYAGPAIRALSMEERMTVCNMSVELGARFGLIAPDEVTFAYLKGRPFAPAGDLWEPAVAAWRALASDPGARFDAEIELDVSSLTPQVSWGTSPQDCIGVGDTVPDPEREADPKRRQAMRRALDYIGLEPGTPIRDLPVDMVFIGSCTNSRIEDLRAAAAVLKGRRVAAGLRALVVPGSGQVRRQAEAEGLDRVFTAAGFEWREPGCSMCAGMNADRVPPGKRCVATSNRNFEGRQGPGARTHLASPATAAAAAVAGRIVDVRSLEAHSLEGSA